MVPELVVSSNPRRGGSFLMTRSQTPSPPTPNRLSRLKTKVELGMFNAVYT